MSIASSSPRESIEQTPLSEQNVTSGSNTLTLPFVLNLCSTINLNEVIDESFTQLSRTNTTGCKHKACVCVICDCFIIGVEKICWLSEERLMAKQSYLSVSHLEAIANERIPIALRNQYKIDNNESLSCLFLSPQAHVIDRAYMVYKSCHIHVLYSSEDKPPKFAISNGWLIGEIPRTIIGSDISDILASSLAKIRIFGNVFSYSAGAHKTIKGYHVFFIHNPEHFGAAFE